MASPSSSSHVARPSQGAARDTLTLLPSTEGVPFTNSRGQAARKENGNRIYDLCCR